MDRRHFLGLAASVFAFPGAASGNLGPHWEEEFDTYVKGNLAQTHTPGLSVAVVHGADTLFVRGYGLADIAANKPVAADTAFDIASVSKTVTGTAMMMLFQEGTYKLDDPIGPHLDFSVIHPKFPHVPITFRHLFTHTAGISDAVEEENNWFMTPGDSALPLRDFLHGYLSVGGRWYNPAKSYSGNRPGTVWSYSNIGVALLGYLAGRVAPEPLDIMTRKRIFAPLGMRNTAWRYADLRPADIATTYKVDSGKFVVLPPMGYPDWPDGGLRTSAQDFAEFLKIYTGVGNVDGKSYLAPKTIATMLAPDQVPVDNPSGHQALIWQLLDVGNLRLAIHGGKDPGATSVAVIDMKNRLGALAFANSRSGMPVFGTCLRLLEWARGAEQRE
jgi:CubicO group peptidase (beta-lactamase class C family)